MICPKCKNKISDFDATCPICGLNLYNENEKKVTKKIISENEENADKTILLRIINALEIISCIILSIVFLIQGNMILALEILFGGIVIFAFIKGFSDIIESLDKISKKLDKWSKKTAYENRF